MEFTPGAVELIGGAILSAAGWYFRRVISRMEAREQKRLEHEEEVLQRIESLEQAVLDLHARLDEQQGREQARIELENARAAESAKIHDGIEALLRDRILQSRRYFVAKKYVPPQEYENIEQMAKCYKSLGGNGVAERAFAEISALPFEPPTE